MFQRRENILVVLLPLFPTSTLSFHYHFRGFNRALLHKCRNRGLHRPICSAEGDTYVPESSRNLIVPETFVFDDSMTDDPTAEELSNSNMLGIILGVATDEEVNGLVWKCLGYRRTSHQITEDNNLWETSKCFPKWRERFPEPPDLVGVTRIYSKDIDGPVLKANQALVRTIPMAYKQSIREHLRPLGFNGFKLDELTPNKTRRAQCSNWLLYYREKLWRVPIDELIKEKERDIEKENIALRAKGQSIKTAEAGVLPRDSYRNVEQADVTETIDR